MDVLVEFPFAQTGSSRVRDSGASFCSNGAIERDYSSDTRARIVEFVNNITCGSSMWESDGQAEENSLQRVKFLCSFGGSILPRPSDGKLRYVGGETRIVCVNRDISYSELMFKMTEFYDQALTLKYQLPEEDLDALVSVLCDDDLANMMEEYDKLEATDGFTRLRVFLFSAAEYDLSPVCEESETDQRYVDALNGVPEAGDPRKTSEISLYGPAESFNCAVADNGSVQRVQAPGIRQHVVISLPISPRNPLIHQVASPPSSPLNHHPPPPASPLGHHRQPAIQLGEPEEYYQEQPWDLGSRMHRQDLMCLASTGLPVVPPEEPYRDSVTATEFTYRAQSEVIHPEINHGVASSQKQRESVEAYTSNDKYRGNLQQVDRHEDVPPLIGVSDRCCEDKPVHDTLSLRVHIHGRNLPQQPYMHPVYQAAGHYPGEVLQDQEFGPQRKFPFHPMECSGVYEDSGLPMSHDFGSSSQTIAASDFCLGSAAPASRLKFSDEHEVYSENQAHMQVVWAPNCAMREANYEQRSEHSNNQWSGPGAPSSAHPNYNHHLVTEKQGRWHHQLPYTEDELRLRGQNINHLQNMFEGNFASKCQCASIKLRENLSKARGLKIYPEHMPPYPDHHGSSRLETQILDPGSEYHPMMVKELSLQNANAQVNQLGYPTDQMHSCAGYQERVDGAVGWAQHDGEELKVSSAQRAPGFLAVEEGMNKDVGRSDYLDHSPRGYYNLQPEEACCLSLHSEFYMDAATSQFELCPRVPAPVNLGTGHRNYDAMISRGNLQQELRASGSADSPHNNIQHRGTGTYFNQASGFHLEPTDRENPWSYSLAGKGNSEANLVQKGGKNLEGLQFPYTSYEVDAAHEPNVPAYMLGDHLQNRIENAFEYEGNLPKEFIPDMDPKLIRDIKDINTSFVSPHFQMHLQRQTHTECPADGFVTLGSNDILSSSACSRAITSSRVLLPDSLTFSLSTEVLPSLLSSVPTSTVLASPILPIYDQSPASSVNVTAPEDLWSDNGKQKQFNECKESVAKASETVQLTEVLISDKQDVRRDLDLDKRMVENCVNDTPEVSICSTFANMDSPVCCCSPSCSSIAPTPKIEGKQTSTGSVKETVYEEVKEEAKLHRSNEEENLLDKNAPQGHSLGLGEESHCDSMNMAKNDLSASETQKLAEELQTIRNDDIEEIRELGSGTYGTVYYGKWKGSDVAIKRIKASCFSGSQSERERMIADFWREARTLGQLHHPNVVAFYGIVRDGPGGTLATVTEYMVNGSLKQVLRRKDRTIDRRKRLIIAMDVAFGMEYLHGKNIVHFDLKSDNLLVNMRDPQRPVCKIGDLGLSKVKQRTLVSGGVRGTLPWMAPELLSGKSGMVTDKIDVYSFGIVMWELLTGEEPYAKMHCGEIIGGIMSNTLRPSIPSWCDPAWRSLMEKCWSFDPGQRPPFPDIAKELRAMAASINLK